MTETPRAIRMGHVTAVAGGRGQLLADRLASRGYRIHETPHFTVCQKWPESRRTVLLHTFDAASIDEDLSPVVAEELGPLGVVTGANEYGAALLAIVASTSPSLVDCPHCGRSHLDLTSVWRQFCLNTLRRLRPLIADGRQAVSPGSHVVQFAGVYRRIIECHAGTSMLDVGTNLGLLPILLAEHLGHVAAVGCDNRTEAVASAEDLANATRADRVTFTLADVLAADFSELGRFDTVTAVHVLEHLPDERIPAALTNMLRAARRRLIVSVPYEPEPEPLYGHLQAYTPEKLRAWGRWCLETQGGGRFWCEDVHGGLLVVDKPTEHRAAATLGTHSPADVSVAGPPDTQSPADVCRSDP